MENIVRELLTRLENDWAPAALETGTAITQINGINSLILGTVLLVVAGVAVYWIRKFVTLKIRDGYSSDWEFGVLGASFTALLTGVPAVVILLNVWTWIAIFNPKLALANNILNAVLKQIGN